MKEKSTLSKERIIKILKNTIVTEILLFIPIAQFYSALIAFPLFLFPAINKSSVLMGYTFGYFYPRNPITLLIFTIYYLIFFYILGYLKERIKNSKEAKKDLKISIIDKTSLEMRKKEYNNKIRYAPFAFFIFSVIFIIISRFFI